MATIALRTQGSPPTTGYLLYGAGVTGAAQVFNSGAGGSLARINFYLKKTGAPTGSYNVALFSVSGTPGVDAIPTTQLSISPSYNVTGLTTSYAFYTANMASYTLLPNTYYAVIVSYGGGDSSNGLNVGYYDDYISSENTAFFIGGGWIGSNTYDVSYSVTTNDTRPQDQTGTANIINSGPTSMPINGIVGGWGSSTWGMQAAGEILRPGSITTTQTITGTSRITKIFPNTQTGISRITKSIPRTQTGTSRVTKSIPVTVTGVSRIEVTTTRNQTGLAYIQVTDVLTTRTTIGTSRIEATITQNQSGISRIQQTVLSIINGLSSIAKPQPKTQTGVARITKTFPNNISGISRITKSIQQSQSGTARIGNSSLQIITGTSRITKTFQATTTGVSRITKSILRTIAGTSRIQSSVTKTISGTATVIIQIKHDITGTSRIGESFPLPVNEGPGYYRYFRLPDGTIVAGELAEDGFYKYVIKPQGTYTASTIDDGGEYGVES